MEYITVVLGSANTTIMPNMKIRDEVNIYSKLSIGVNGGVNGSVNVSLWDHVMQWADSNEWEMKS